MARFMGLHYTIIDHTNSLNIDLGKKLNHRFQFATNEDLVKGILKHIGHLEIRSEHYNVEDYEDMDFKDWLNAP